LRHCTEVARTAERWRGSLLVGGLGFEAATPTEMLLALPDALLTTIPPGSDVAGVPGRGVLENWHSTGIGSIMNLNRDVSNAHRGLGTTNVFTLLCEQLS
jgi:hypothetical protein